jgi:hypothetical protein
VCSASKENIGKLIELIAAFKLHRCDEIIRMALMEGDKNSDGYKRICEWKRTAPPGC